MIQQRNKRYLLWACIRLVCQVPIMNWGGATITLSCDSSGICHPLVIPTPVTTQTTLADLSRTQSIIKRHDCENGLARESKRDGRETQESAELQESESTIYLYGTFKE